MEYPGRIEASNSKLFICAPRFVCMQYLFRFDKPRPSQDAMLKDIYNALDSGRDILVNAPTGVGKTDAALGAALTCALENDLRVMFLTPKISQHSIAIEAANGIKRRFGLDFTLVDMVGKKNLCTNAEVNCFGSDSFYSACERVVKAKSCRFFEKYRAMAEGNHDEKLREVVAEHAGGGHNKLFDACFDAGLCAYEVSAYAAKRATVVIGDYPHILNPGIKPAFLKKLARDLSDTIIIWDEAHNIVSAASSYLSNSLGTWTIRRAMAELSLIGDKTDISYLEFALSKLASDKLGAMKMEGAFVDIGELSGVIMANLDELVRMFQERGLEYSQKTKAKRSALLHIARFLSAWNTDDPASRRIITGSGKTARLAIECLYPGRALSVFGEAYGNVFMSATLLPLEMHANLLGVKSADMRSYASPFPRANRLAFVDASATTKYESRSAEQYGRIADRITAIKDAVPGNVAVFFPSFDVLKGVHRHMKRGSIYVQRSDISSAELERLLHEFKGSADSLLFGVMGGSLGEGVDYPGNIIKGIVIVGIPLARPDIALRARVEYFDGLFPGKGSEYVYTTPAIVRALQAAGRAVRSESDRAVVVFLDSRYRYGVYSKLIRDTMGLVDGPDCTGAIKEFWRDSKEAARAVA